jgi:hypothetical protein
MGRLDEKAPPMSLGTTLDRSEFISTFMRGKWFLRAAFILCLTSSCAFAHVGNPDVYYEGDAGRYHLFVTVRVPQVIPGIAEIEVRSQSNDVQTVRLVPLTLTGPGSNLPPVPDLAEQSKQDSQFFSGNLWLMQSGALQVRILIEGSKGHGELSVPVPSFAQTTLPMQKPLAAVLIALMLFLSFGLISIVSASVRQGSLEAGQAPSPSNLHRSRVMMAITAVVVVTILCFGRAWWTAEGRDYQSGVDFFKPPEATITLENGRRMLIQSKEQDDKWHHRVKLDGLLPDHNHLMHLFLIRVPGLDRMWHLHPDAVQGKETIFVQDLPSMSSGHYQLFADVVDKTGFPWTLVGKLEVADPLDEAKPLTGDDSSWSGAAIGSAANDSTVYPFPDGGRMVWQRDTSDPIRANTAMRLTFNILDKNGRPAQDMEPYMGMAGHAEVVRSDLGVFAHIHPAGSVSMAALQLAQASLPGGATRSMHDGMNLPMSLSPVMGAASVPTSPQVTFPYGFPQPGSYRIFVQIKRAGRVLTAAFDAHVQ